jgi:hypothetical protein
LVELKMLPPSPLIVPEERVVEEEEDCKKQYIRFIWLSFILNRHKKLFKIIKINLIHFTLLYFILIYFTGLIYLFFLLLWNKIYLL